MGLAEKRLQQEFENDRIPKRMESFKTEYCPKASFAIEIDWKTFEGDKAAMDNLWSIWEQPLSGLEGVCTDDLGKAAVAESVKRVRILNVPKVEEVKVEFKDGVLTVAMACSQGGSGTPGWTTIKEAVEAGL